MNTFSMTSSSFAARHNLIDEEKSRVIAEVLARLEKEEIETVRVNFVDQHGIMRGKTLTSKGLAAAFEAGVSMTSTLLLKDTSHNTVFPIWQESDVLTGHMMGAADFLMLPDPSTFRVLPWAPHSAWILSDLYFTDGDPVPYDTRRIAKDAVRALEEKGYSFTTGLEVEFYVLEIVEDNLDHNASGRPEEPPETRLLSHGYQYLTEQRYDQLELVMDLIRRNAEKLGLPVRSMEAEFGPSQFEFTFEASRGIINADAMILFRTISCAVQNSRMPWPMAGIFTNLSVT
jgi:glutamine synthetase